MQREAQNELEIDTTEVELADGTTLVRDRERGDRCRSEHCRIDLEDAMQLRGQPFEGYRVRAASGRR